jgi:hypothetical protein
LFHHEAVKQNTDGFNSFTKASKTRQFKAIDFLTTPTNSRSIIKSLSIAGLVKVTKPSLKEKLIAAYGFGSR